jgi:hypothetical protein
MGKILTLNNRDTEKLPHRLRGVPAAPCCSSLFVPSSSRVVGSYLPTILLRFLFVRSLAESKF